MMILKPSSSFVPSLSLAPCPHPYRRSRFRRATPVFTPILSTSYSPPILTLIVATCVILKWYISDADLPFLCIFLLKGDQLFPSWEEMFKEDEGFNPDIPILSFDGRDVRRDPRWSVFFSYFDILIGSVQIIQYRG